MSQNPAENRNRQPKGVSTGGQFAREHKPETQAAPLIAPTASTDSTPVELAPGDSHHIDGDRENFSHFEIIRDHEGIYRAEGCVYENFSSAKPGYAENLSDEAWAEYINDRAPIIEKFIQDRYGDPYESVYTGTADGGEHDIYFSVELGEDAVTEAHAVDRVWNETTGVQFIREMDPGTFGAENAGRMLRAKFEEYDAQKIEAEYAPSGVQTEQFTDGVIDALVEEQKHVIRDGGYEDIDPDTDVSEMVLDPEDEARLRQEAERFLDENFGDIEAFARASGQDLRSVGYDFYTSAARMGVGFTDRVSPAEIDYVVAHRLTESVSKEFTAADLEGSTEIGDDGRIHIGWTNRGQAAA